MKLSILFLFVLTVACNGNYLRLEKNRNLKRCHPLKAGKRHHGTHYHHVVTGASSVNDISVVYYACGTGVTFVNCVSQGTVINIPSADRTITEENVGAISIYNVEANSPSHNLRIVAKITITSTGATHIESSTMCAKGKVPGNGGCDDCSKGEFNDGSQETCKPCVGGYFSDSTGASACTQHDSCLNKEITVAGTTKTDNTCADCKVLYYIDGGVCTTCPSGYSCAGAAALPQCANTCNNGGVITGTFGSSTCACDCASTGYEGTDCSTKKTCNPAAVPNSNKKATGAITGVFNDTVTVTCDDGYTAVLAEATCEADGSFTLPSCVVANYAPCDATKLPQYGALVGTCNNSLALGGSCKPTCNTGYELTVDSKCDAVGTLTKGTCSEKGCSKPALLTNGINGTCTGDIISGGGCVPGCNDYYTLTGGTVITCSKGDLSNVANPLSCVENDCGAVNNNNNEEEIDCNLGTITGKTGTCGCKCDFDNSGTLCDTPYSFLYGYVKLKEAGKTACSSVCAKWHGDLVDDFAVEAIDRNDATALGIKVIDGDAICSYLLSDGQLLKSIDC
jgi:hypothetical protein